MYNDGCFIVYRAVEELYQKLKEMTRYNELLLLNIIHNYIIIITSKFM